MQIFVQQQSYNQKIDINKKCQHDSIYLAKDGSVKCANKYCSGLSSDTKERYIHYREARDAQYPFGDYYDWDYDHQAQEDRVKERDTGWEENDAF